MRPKTKGQACVALAKVAIFFGLLPPNDGLLKPNDDLLPPNDGLLPPNEIITPLLNLSARPMPSKNGPRPTLAPPEGVAKAAKCLTNGRAAASLHAYTRFPLTDAEKSSHEKRIIAR